MDDSQESKKVTFIQNLTENYGINAYVFGKKTEKKTDKNRLHKNVARVQMVLTKRNTVWSVPSNFLILI